jgi:hypothetical protein
MVISAHSDASSGKTFSGRPKARCYPFNILGHRFGKKNPQVQSLYRTQYRYHYRVAILHYIIPDIVYDIVYDIGIDIIKLMMLLVQDCVCVVAPSPFRIEKLEDFDLIGDLDVT